MVYTDGMMCFSRIFLLSALCSTIVFSGFPALAGDKEDSPTTISVSIENDNFGGNSDRYYTSGVRLSWFNEGIDVPPVIDKMADRVPTFDLNETTSVYYTFGQNLYSPKNIRLEDQPQDDRPWAGFLYGSVGLSTTTWNAQVPAHIDDLEFTLGVVGPEALGKPTQRFVHRYFTGSPDPRGWKNQLDFEPGFIVSWQRRMPQAFSYDEGPFTFRIEPNFSIALGNIYTYGGVGATFVLGSSLNEDTPPRVRPSIPGTGVFSKTDHGLNWQIFAGLDGRVVGRNIFLDGNTFSDSHSVDKKYLVGDASAGFSLSYDDYRLSYTLNARSNEFDTQDETSIFGSVTLTKRF